MILASLLVGLAIFPHQRILRSLSEQSTHSISPLFSVQQPSSLEVINEVTIEEKKGQLFNILSSTESNSLSSTKLTTEVLKIVRDLESVCPTPDENVLSTATGNWALLYTAQDKEESDKLGVFRSFINPLENQSYSNKVGGGRSNPILPQNIQDQLEKMGILIPEKPTSSQSIDINRKRVRNVVTFDVQKDRRVTITVDVKFQPNMKDLRKIDVKFDSCRVVVQNAPIDITIPLGIIGPSGWLRTTYIDSEIRISRGHKGSVFILKRPSAL